MGFEVKTVLGKEEVMAYQRISGRTIQRRRTLFARISLIAVAILGLTGSAVGVAAAGFTGSIALGILLCAACFAMGTRWYEYVAWRSGRKVPEGFTQTFYFDENNVVGQAEGQQVLHRYSDFAGAAESENYFCLFLNKKVGYILPKEGFLKGEPKDFGAFIQQKTGKDLPFVKI